MRLVSTFRDYYDPFFDGRGDEFVRTGGNVGPAKSEQLHILESLGFATPPHGRVEDVLDSWWEAERTWVRWVVAYTDPAAHCGEGKELFNRGRIRSNPDMSGRPRFTRERALFCTAFVGDPFARPAVSWRRLQVGRRVFWVEYTSTASWMSNVGDGTCVVIGDAGVWPDGPYPLWAVDFVLGREMYAVDLNTAPGIRGSGVEKVLGGPEVVSEIEGWFARHKER